jgi:predicted GIY-YIG superfamily endonuclease
MCGVYYLWDGASVLYVGASTNVRARIQAHCRNGIDFCGYFCDECAEDQLHDLEQAAIMRYAPPFNIIGLA